MPDTQNRNLYGSTEVKAKVADEYYYTQKKRKLNGEKEKTSSAQFLKK